MIGEVIAALLVGGLALALILEPLLQSKRRAASPLDLPDPEETPRGIALSALKEIEFDKATGKLSDADYALLKDQYTQAAVQAMRAEEQSAPEAVTAAEPGDAVEAIIDAKVRALRQPAGEGSPQCPGCGPRPEPDAVFCSTCGKRLPTGTTCASCGTALAPAAKFCESCGSRQALSA
jgi:hypothetical protein